MKVWTALPAAALALTVVLFPAVAWADDAPTPGPTDTVTPTPDPTPPYDGPVDSEGNPWHDPNLDDPMTNPALTDPLFPNYYSTFELTLDCDAGDFGVYTAWTIAWVAPQISDGVFGPGVEIGRVGEFGGVPQGECPRNHLVTPEDGSEPYWVRDPLPVDPPVTEPPVVGASVVQVAAALSERWVGYVGSILVRL